MGFFLKKALAKGVKCSLRLNPQTSFSPTDAYNPCGKFSRLGITKANLEKAIGKNLMFGEEVVDLNEQEADKK